MLHVLNVPKGTRFMSMNVGGGSFYQYPSRYQITHFFYRTSVVVLFPYPGAPTAFSERLDPGFLFQGATYGNLKDVEHLDLSGTIIPREYCGALSPKNPADTWKSPTCSTWLGLLVKRINGSTGLDYYTSICPYFATQGRTVDLVGDYTTSGKAYPWRASTAEFWPTTHVFCQLVYFDRTDLTTKPEVKCYCLKFSDDFTKFSQFQVSIDLAVSYRYAAWDSLVEAVRDRVHGDSILITPSVLTSSSAPELWADLPSRAFEWSGEVLDRSEVFSGELNPVWGDLAYDCYTQVQLWDNNAIAYGKDLAVITTALRSLVTSAKLLVGSKNPKAALKSLADLFLSFRYGWSLTCKDTLSLLEMDYARAYPQGSCKRSSSYSYFRNGYTMKARMSVYCQPYSNCISELAGFLQMIDLELTAENIWDLIPYSFVVDWVFNVGDLLKRWDVLGQLDRYNILLTGQTLEAMASMDASKIMRLSSMVGNVYAHYYKRAYTSDVILPSLASSRNSDQKFNNWLEGAALVVQRR